MRVECSCCSFLFKRLILDRVKKGNVMITGAKVIGLPDVFDEGDMEQQFVQVSFDDGTFVNLNEEELRNAAALAEKGCLSE